jgi:hypothetical protein
LERKSTLDLGAEFFNCARNAGVVFLVISIIFGVRVFKARTRRRVYINPKRIEELLYLKVWSTFSATYETVPRPVSIALKARSAAFPVRVLLGPASLDIPFDY